MSNYGDGGPTYGELFYGDTYGTLGRAPGAASGARLRIRPRRTDLPSGFGSPTPDVGNWIRWAPAGTRVGGAALNGATLGSTPVSVYVSTSSSGAVTVVPVVDGVDRPADTASPFDVYGADAGDVPATFPALADGTHTVGAKITKGDGSKVYVEATFTAAGMAGGGGGGGGGGSADARAAIGSYITSTKLQQQLVATVNFRTDYASWRGQTWGDVKGTITSELADTSWRTGTWTKVLAITMLPDPAMVPGVNLADGAAGLYDQHLRDIRDTLKAIPVALLKRLRIRLAWEFNAAWYPFGLKWKTNDSAQWDRNADSYAAYWRKWWSIIMDPTTGLGSSTGVKWVWCPVGPPVTRTSDKTLTERAYPGTGYVDVISIDYYTNQPGQNNINFRAAMAWVTAFAIAKSTPGKVLLTAVDETSSGMTLNTPTGTVWRAGWDSTPPATDPYKAGDVVVQESLVYMALVAPGTTEPGTDPAKWRRILVGRGVWAAGTYAKGDVATLASSGAEYVSNVDGNTATPGSGSNWKALHNGGLGDYPLWAEELVTWMVAELIAKRLDHVNLWELDSPREKLFGAMVVRQWIYPGRDNWKVGQLPVQTTTGSNVVTLSGDGGGGFDQADQGYSLSASAGIPAGATIVSVATDGKSANISAVATATGARTATVGGIPDPSAGCNFPLASRRLIHRLSEAAA